MKKAKAHEFIVNDEWFHLMPGIGHEDSLGFEESIRQKGILQPIEVRDDMTILDGHRRHQVAEKLGIDIPYIVKSIPIGEAPRYIIETNLYRRHLTKFQKIIIAHNTAREWGWFEEAKERMTAGKKAAIEAGHAEMDPPPADGGGSKHEGETLRRIAQAFKVPREGLELYKRLQKEEEFNTIADLTRDVITMNEVQKRLDAKRSESKPTPMTMKYTVGMTNGIELYRESWKRLGDRLFTPATGDTMTISIKYHKVPSRERKETEEKPWKPIPFRGLACSHGVVGGCWRCYPELGEENHQRKSSAHKQDAIRLPIDQKEIGSFTIRPDSETEVCHKCTLFIDGRCEWVEGTEVPKGCRKFKHRRK